MNNDGMLSSRVKSLIKRDNITYEELAKNSGLHYNTILRIIKKGVATTETLLTLAKTFKTNCSYLLGETEYDGVITEDCGNTDIAHIPMLDISTPAYTGSFSVYKKSVYRFLDMYGDLLRCTIMIGDSMFPKFRDGDIILFVESSECVTGYNVVFRYYDRLYIRTLELRNGTYVFRAANRECPEIRSSKLKDEINIIGRVVGSIPAARYDD